jgi:hypothetical protein
MIIHYGEFGLQKVGENTDLIGSNVNLTHRLAKNSIKEKTNISDYAFFTKACIEALHLIDFAEKTMVLHTESYEHIGEVMGYVYDLCPVWQRDRERHRVILSPEEIALETHFVLPVAPPVAWDYLLDPEIRKSFLGSDRIDTSKIDGRMTIGSRYHCAHGDVVLDQLVLDWQPFDYFTIEQFFPLPGKMKARARGMTELVEVINGTRVINYYAKPVSSNPLAKIMLQMSWNKTKEMIKTSSDFTEKTLLETIEANRKLEKPLIKMTVPTG